MVRIVFGATLYIQYFIRDATRARNPALVSCLSLLINMISYRSSVTFLPRLLVTGHRSTEAAFVPDGNSILRACAEMYMYISVAVGAACAYIFTSSCIAGWSHDARATGVLLIKVATATKTNFHVL